MNQYDLMLLVLLLSASCCNTSSGSNQCNPPKRASNFTGADVIIGGLVPVHVGSSHRLNKAGIMWVEAFMYAIRAINADQKLLANLTLGYDIRDSCNLKDLALQATLDFLMPPVALNDSMMQQTNNMSCVCRSNETTRKPAVMAVIGGASSSISITVSPLLSVDSMPQVSYSSTSPSLSIKQRYRSFLRTIPSDIYQAEAIADMLAYFNWTYVSIVVTDDEYGRNGLGALRTHLKTRDICIAVEEMFTKSPESVKRHDMERICAKLQADKHSSVVVLWCDHEPAKEFLSHVTGKVTNMTWIGVESWGDNLNVKDNVDFDTIAGMLGVLPYQGRYEPFENYLTTLTATTTSSAVHNPWLPEYWDEQRLKCGGKCSDFQSAADLPPNKYANVIDAVYAIAHGLHSLRAAHPNNLTLDREILPELLEHVKKVEFKALSEKGNFKFSQTGDPVYGAYLIKNLQRNNNVKEFVTIGDWNGEQRKLKINKGIQWTTGVSSAAPLSRCSDICARGFAFVQSSRECCWSCVRCAEDFVKSMRGNTGCVKCPRGYTSNTNRTTCVQLEADFLRWSSIAAIVVLVFSFLGLVIIAFLLAIFWKYSKTAIVKASNRELSVFHLVCHGLVFILPAFFMGEPVTAICVLRSYLFMILFTVITSITFLKTDRIVRIFNSKARLTKRSRLLSNKVQLMLMLAMAVLPTAGTTVWVLLRPLTSTSRRSVFSGHIKMVLYCGNTASSLHLIQLSYILLIALLCTYEAYNARKLPENFNEAKFICFSMFGFVLMWIGYIPGYLDTVGSTKQFITCIFLLLTNYTTLLVIYAPKLNIILFHPEDNRHERFRRATMKSCLAQASRIPSPTTTPVVTTRCRSVSLPNAFSNLPASGPPSVNTSTPEVTKPRSWSVLTEGSVSSHEDMTNKARNTHEGSTASAKHTTQMTSPVDVHQKPGFYVDRVPVYSHNSPGNATELKQICEPIDV